MKIISTRPCLRLRTNLEPRIAFWGPDLGYILVPVSGSIFGRGFGALCKVRFKCLCACDFPCQDAMAFEDVFGHGANLG